MRGVVLVPGDKQDLLWLNNNFSIDHASWKDLLLDPGGTRDLPGGSFTSSACWRALWLLVASIFSGSGWTTQSTTKPTTQLLPLASAGPQTGRIWAETSPARRWSTRPRRTKLTCSALVQTKACSTAVGTARRGATGKNSGAASPALRLSCRRRPERMIFSHAARTFLSITPIGRPHPRQCGLRWVVACLENQGRPQLLQSFVFHSGAFVFVAAGDGSIWYTFSDGVVWKAWNSLGPAYKTGSGKAAIRFISEPVVAAFFPNSDVTFGIPPGVGGISTGVAPPPAGTGSGPPPPATVISGHVRVDVFAVGEDNALWHKWLTDGAWHGELNGDLETGNWSQVPGASLACAPSLLSFNRGETVISMPPVRDSNGSCLHRWNNPSVEF